MIPVGPEHDDKADDEVTEEASAEVAILARHTREENGRVPQMKLILGNGHMEREHEEGRNGTNGEAVWATL